MKKRRRRSLTEHAERLMKEGRTPGAELVPDELADEIAGDVTDPPARKRRRKKCRRKNPAVSVHLRQAYVEILPTGSLAVHLNELGRAMADRDEAYGAAQPLRPRAQIPFAFFAGSALALPSNDDIRQMPEIEDDEARFNETAFDLFSESADPVVANFVSPHNDATTLYGDLRGLLTVVPGGLVEEVLFENPNDLQGSIRADATVRAALWRLVAALVSETAILRDAQIVYRHLEEDDEIYEHAGDIAGYIRKDLLSEEEVDEIMERREYDEEEQGGTNMELYGTEVHPDDITYLDDVAQSRWLEFPEQREWKNRNLGPAEQIYEVGRRREGKL